MRYLKGIVCTGISLKKRVEMQKTLVLQIVYELMQIAKQIYAKYRRNKAQREIESIEEDTMEAWGSEFGTIDRGMPSNDKSADPADTMPTKKADDAAR